MFISFLLPPGILSGQFAGARAATVTDSEKLISHNNYPGKGSKIPGVWLRHREFLGSVCVWFPAPSLLIPCSSLHLSSPCVKPVE